MNEKESNRTLWGNYIALPISLWWPLLGVLRTYLPTLMDDERRRRLTEERRGEEQRGVNPHGFKVKWAMDIGNQYGFFGPISILFGFYVVFCQILYNGLDFKRFCAPDRIAGMSNSSIF